MSIHHWYITCYRYIVPINVSVQIPYQERYYAFCWSVRSQFRCSRYRIQMKNEIRTEYKEKQRLVTECCEGYTRSLNGSTCIPVCSDTCIHGHCVRPDTCQCELGFGGKDCSKCNVIITFWILNHCTFCVPVCEPGLWGPDCSRTCPCKNGATCDPVSGDCTCTPGYHGALCDTRCNHGNYGFNCAEKCRCKNGKYFIRQHHRHGCIFFSKILIFPMPYFENPYLSSKF